MVAAIAGPSIGFHSTLGGISPNQWIEKQS
jgi:hypothetical protein